MPINFNAQEQAPKLSTKQTIDAINLWMQKHQKSLDDQKDQVSIIKWIMIAIVIVLFTTIGAMFQSYIATRTATYQSLVDKVTEENVKINLLYEALDKTNSRLDQNNLDSLKIKNYFGIK